MNGDESGEFAKETTTVEYVYEEQEEEEENGDETEQAPEEREVGDLLTEDEADAVYELQYETDSKATAGQLENPVTLLEKDDKQYVQIPINEDGAQLFRSLQINGEEVTWNSISDAPYVIQFALPNGIEEELDLSMVIQAGPRVMSHDVKISFDEDSMKPVKEPEEPESQEPELDPENLDEGVYTLDYTFLAKGTDDPSAMDGFTEGPAHVKVDEDGNQFIAMTLTSADWIKNFAINNEDVKILGENEEADTRVVEFPIEDLTQKHEGTVVVEVPDKFKTEREFDLVFDTDSLQTAADSEYPADTAEPEEPQDPEEPEAQQGEVTVSYVDQDGEKVAPTETLHGDIGESFETAQKDVDGYDLLEVDGDETGKFAEEATSVEYVYEKQQEEKPEENGNGTMDNGNGDGSGDGESMNPETGDSTSWILYVLLLVGSGIPLAFIGKRRFA